MEQRFLIPAGEPLKMASYGHHTPLNRSGVTLEEKEGGYAVRMERPRGSCGRWHFVYDLAPEVTACHCRVRHNGSKENCAKGLILGWMSWLDADGRNIETCYLEAEGSGVLSRAMPRPEGAVQLMIGASLRYCSDEVIFRDIVCTPVTLKERKARIVVAKITPAQGGSATCEDNQARMESVFKQLEQAGEKPDLIVFPETLLTRWVRDLGPEMGAQPIPGPHTDWAANWAKRLNTNVVVSLREKDNGVFYNSAAVIDRSGRIVGVYHKSQLCIGEYECGYDWGTELPVFELDFGKIGVLICWDMWFPEAIRTLRLRGAEVIAYPIAATSRKHFDWMWRVRAMENGVVLAAAISGGDSCPSRVISATGELLAESYTPQTYAAATVDLRDPKMFLRYLSVDSGAGESRTFYTHERHPELYRSLSDLEDKHQ